MQLITSASVTLSAPVVLLDLTATAIATLTAGYRQIIALPRSLAYLEWLGLQAVTVGTMTAGAYIAWIGKDVDAVNFGAASGFSIK
jgi:pseudouridine-5'-phosphate glycosidase